MIFRRSDKYKEKKRLKTPGERKKRSGNGDVTEHYKASPTFGNIPMIQETRMRPSGCKETTWVYDPDYEPPLPPRAIRGDVRKQCFCPMCHEPKYFYVDNERKCVQCGQLFTFTAKEQKYWFETLHFHIDSRAIRCVSCRRQRRSDVAVKALLDSALARVKTSPDDPLALIELAESSVRHFERFNQGSLERAISACRKALKLSPVLFESIYWEAVCHENAGRVAKAAGLYGKFITEAGSVKRCRTLMEKAQKRLKVIMDK